MCVSILLQADNSLSQQESSLLFPCCSWRWSQLLPPPSRLLLCVASWSTERLSQTLNPSWSFSLICGARAKAEADGRSMRYGTDDRAGGQTSDPVILSRTTSLQGLPREPLDVSVGKMQPGPEAAFQFKLGESDWWGWGFKRWAYLHLHPASECGFELKASAGSVKARI